MKKVCLIIRDGYDAKYIISELNKKSNIKYSYIIEGGKSARTKKLKRMIRKSNIFDVFVNVCILLIYDSIMQRKMKKICGQPKYPPNCRYIHVDDVNDAKCWKAVEKVCPDLILVYGTGILRADTIKSFGDHIYNIHSSILPYYRNVHSDFWAYMDGRRELIGVTIFKLDSGIDMGKIACQKRCDLPDYARLYEYKVQNLINIPKMIEKFVLDYFEGEIILKPQNPFEGSTASTPGTKSLVKFLLKEGFKVKRS